MTGRSTVLRLAPGYRLGADMAEKQKILSLSDAMAGLPEDFGFFAERFRTTIQPALAAREGVDEALLQEWAISQPALESRSVQAAAIAVPKAWRYVGEMKEIAAALAKAGLPTGFHLGAAELYEKLTGFKDMTNPPPTIPAVVNTLNR